MFYMRGKYLDLIGQRFDRLIIVSLATRTKSGKVWLCLCDCGNYCKKMTTQLRRKNAVARACQKCETDTRSRSKIKHGGKSIGVSQNLYHIWTGIHKRCYGVNQPSYKYYGGKGIIVCAEWSDFVVFRKWALKAGYKDGLSIDRLDPELNYSPENCQIVTRSENSRRGILYRKRKLALLGA